MGVVVLRIASANVMFVHCVTLRVHNIIMSASNGGTAMVHVIMLMLVGVMQGEIWVGVDIALARKVMPLRRQGVVSLFVRSDFSVCVRGCYPFFRVRTVGRNMCQV